MRRGFTLIEILVVVAIFGLISSVALANLQSAKEKARRAAGLQFETTLQRTLGDEVAASWDFDEGSGSTAIDTSGNNLNGESVGAQYVPDGIHGSALYFDGSSYISGDNFPNPGNNGTVTVSMWIRPTNVASPNTIFFLGDETCQSLQVMVNGGKGVTKNDEQETAITEREIQNNVWQNLIFVYHDDLVDTYLNGELIGSVADNGTSACSNGHWSIGAAVTSSGQLSGTGFEGFIDGLRIYTGTP